MLGDNLGLLALVKNLYLDKRSKYIDICYHFIRDLNKRGKLNIAYIPTNEILAT